MRDALRLISPAVLLFALVLRGSGTRLVRHFQRATAFASAEAVPLPSQRPLQGWWLARLTKAHVLHREADGRYWLDVLAWQAYRQIRRQRGVLVGAALVLLGAVWWAWQSRGN